MSRMPRKFAIAVIAALVVCMTPIAAAQAQWYSSYPPAPAYSYGVPPQQPYAVEVAPNTYEIHRPNKPRAGAQVRRATDSDPPVSERPRRTHSDPALIEELAKRHIKTKVINTTKVVREKPVVIEHTREVEDPPRIIERRHITEDVPGRGLFKQRREVGEEEVVIQPGGHDAKVERPAKGKRSARDANTKRVIRAEAEVTILGPDRMSIRLFRKGHVDDANAEVQ
jgi:hypothetical protein